VRQHTPELLPVLTGSFTRRLFANVFHGTNRVLEDVPFESWSLTGDIDAKVKYWGAGAIVCTTKDGKSLSPIGTAGILSPFRMRLELVMEITAADFRERVSLGMFRATAVPRSKDTNAIVNGDVVTTASRVEVTFHSLEENVRRRGMRFPEQPPTGASCFSEIRRLTDMPVQETVDDVAAPPITYEAKQEGRLNAVGMLADELGGVPIVNSAGAWVIIPDEIGEPVAELHLGKNGTVTDVGNEIDTDTIYNCVVGIFEDNLRNPIYSVAEVTTGPLAVGGDYGENTRYYASDKVTTQEQADSAVKAILALSTGAQEYDVPIQCHVNPLIELGDVTALLGWTRDLTGRVVRVALSDSALMNVTLRVPRSL
jgi:hypothetical protein